MKISLNELIVNGLLWGLIGLGNHGIAIAHEGPDPVLHLRFKESQIENNRLNARLGPAATIKGGTRIINDEFGGSLYFDGRQSECIIAADVTEVREYLPKRDFTVAAWVSIDSRLADGGLIGVLQDNGDAECGWLLGYNNDRFSFALASTGADDGNGKLTYLRGKTKYETGRMYHVAAVYDGEVMQLFVNGQLDGESKEQSGDILYPETAPWVVAAYHDRNEFFPHRGCIREVSLYDLAAKESWVQDAFSHASSVAALRPNGTTIGDLSFVIKPYLQFGTQTTMTVMWETSKKAQGTVHFGETAECEQQLAMEQPASIHSVKIEELKPQTQYFYRTVTETAEGDFLESDTFTFVTAVHEQTPYAFAVIGDTQGNPPVASKLAGYAWAQRPSFAIHAGDLVDTGTTDTDWTTQFFPSMNELMCRVPLYPVLGNHEQNADNYFNYMSLPAPEYYYQFRFGNAHFFMIDSNRNVDPESEQYRWLDEQLGKSDAVWKFVCHHHPPFSSDENDYGDLWKTNRSTHGDLRVRQLTTLYEKHHVDIVWNGHIHSYERTWPVNELKSVEQGGTIYVVTGGGGGGLETAGPIRPFFQNNVRHGHHYVMVYVSGSTLEFKAFDLDDRLFDTMVIKKK